MVSKNGVSKINQKNQNFEKHPKKIAISDFFFEKNPINENFQFGKKKSGCKKNSAVKKMSIPPPTVAHGDMSADHDFFYVRPNQVFYTLFLDI